MTEDENSRMRRVAVANVLKEARAQLEQQNDRDFTDEDVAKRAYLNAIDSMNQAKATWERKYAETARYAAQLKEEDGRIQQREARIREDEARLETRLKQAAITAQAPSEPKDLNTAEMIELVQLRNFQLRFYKRLATSLNLEGVDDLPDDPNELMEFLDSRFLPCTGDDGAIRAHASEIQADSSISAVVLDAAEWVTGVKSGIRKEVEEEVRQEYQKRYDRLVREVETSTTRPATQTVTPQPARTAVPAEESEGTDVIPDYSTRLRNANVPESIIREVVAHVNDAVKSGEHAYRRAKLVLEQRLETMRGPVAESAVEAEAQYQAAIDKISEELGRPVLLMLSEEYLRRTGQEGGHKLIKSGLEEDSPPEEDLLFGMNRVTTHMIKRGIAGKSAHFRSAYAIKGIFDEAGNELGRFAAIGYEDRNKIPSEVMDRIAPAVAESVNESLALLTSDSELGRYEKALRSVDASLAYIKKSSK